MSKQVAILPDDTIVSRNVGKKVYTYIVAVSDSEGNWRVANWCSRPELATKYANEQRRYQERKYCDIADIEVVPVGIA